MKKILFICKSCESQGDEPCYIIVVVNPDRNLRTPAYCINDGGGARWIKSKDKKLLKKYIG